MRNEVLKLEIELTALGAIILESVSNGIKAASQLTALPKDEVHYNISVPMPEVAHPNDAQAMSWAHESLAKKTAELDDFVTATNEAKARAEEIMKAAEAKKPTRVRKKKEAVPVAEVTPDVEEPKELEAEDIDMVFDEPEVEEVPEEVIEPVAPIKEYVKDDVLTAIKDKIGQGDQAQRNVRRDKVIRLMAKEYNTSQVGDIPKELYAEFIAKIEAIN